MIAKKERCLKATDYRLISLTTSLYKINAKTLAERLKQTLPSSISKNQLAFVKNRQIINAILYISKGGKLTLIQSTLASLPTYMMIVFKAPKSIYKNIEKY